MFEPTLADAIQAFFMKRVVTVCIALIKIIGGEIVHAQVVGLQPFPSYSVAVGCNCILKPAPTIEQNVLMATLPLGTAMPPLKEKALAYE